MAAGTISSANGGDDDGVHHLIVSDLDQHPLQKRIVGIGVEAGTGRWSPLPPVKQNERELMVLVRGEEVHLGLPHIRNKWCAISGWRSHCVASGRLRDR